MPMMLQAGTMESLSRGVDAAELPKTFGEAVHVTRFLGVQYLWIDSLCIIQDSHEDWQRESALMHLIYSQGLCNIAATSSLNGSGGLFYERDVRTLRPLRVSTGCQVLIPHYNWFWKDSVEDAPLNQRAWVFQERFLSPRTLHFAQSQIFWECEAQCACAAFQETIPDFVQVGGPRRKRELQVALQRAFSSPSRKGDLEIYRAWGSAVCNYAKRGLTRTTDKLIAIGGVASVIQAALNDKYLAGLFSRYLANELLWIADSLEKQERPKDYVGPSWSWSSIISEVRAGEIRYEDQRDILIDITHADVNYSSTNIFGQASSGNLQVRCKLGLMGMAESRRHPLLAVGREFEPVDLVIYPDVTATDDKGLTHEPKESKIMYCMPVRDDTDSNGFPSVLAWVLQKGWGL